MKEVCNALRNQIIERGVREIMLFTINKSSFSIALEEAVMMDGTIEDERLFNLILEHIDMEKLGGMGKELTQNMMELLMPPYVRRKFINECIDEILERSVDLLNQLLKEGA